eukprot:gene20481-22497_t
MRKQALIILTISIIGLVYIYNGGLIKLILVRLAPGLLPINIKVESEVKYHENLKAEFKKQWCRVLQARTDWKAILKPCRGQTSWKARNINRMDFLETDPKQSFVSFLDIKPAGEFSRIIIKTLTKDGAAKTVGGDSWRVKINGTSSLTANIFDHNNGTYEVLFLCEDEGEYNVYIYLDYSMCNGLMDPPENWFAKGNSQGKYQGKDVIGTPNDFLMKPLDKTPFIPLVAKMLATSYGTDWEDGRKEFGRPILKSLKRRHRLCGQIFKSCKFSYNWIYHVSNITQSKSPRRDNLDFDANRVMAEFKNTLYESKDHNNPRKNALIFNFGLHFVESTNFSNYQYLINKIVSELTFSSWGRKNGGYSSSYGSNLFWKSSTAIQKERADLPQLHWRRFFTNYRIQLYNAFAADVMCSSKIHVIDDYPISESYPLGTGTHAGKSIAKNDIVHYNNEAFYPVEKFLQKFFQSVTT